MLLDRYNQTIDELYAKVRTTQRNAIINAGKMIAESVKNGGCVHIFDTGHIIDCELINRGGGLFMLKRFKYNFSVDNAVRRRDRSGIKQATPSIAAYAVENSGALPGDVIIIGSVSGKTSNVIDLALEAKKFGMKVIAVTSMSYSSQVKSEHPSGLRLFETADLVLDNCAPAAEALMEVEGLEARLCAASGLSATYILWSVVTVIVEELLKDGITPSVYKSANFPGGNEYNQEREKIYASTGF